MANELAIAMRDAGTELAETFANRDSSGSRTRYGTVTANNGATLDVKLAGGSVSGVPMTTACVGARAGDRVLLTVDGPLITATGILATADNGAYVNRGWSRLYSSGDQSIAVRVVAGIVFLHANLARPTSGRAYCKIDSSLRPLNSIYLPTFYYGEDHVMGLWVPGKQSDDDSIYVYDVAGKAVWFQGIWSWPYEG